MNFFKLNARRRRLLRKYLQGIKINKDTCRFISNHIKWLRFNRERNTKIPHPTNLMLELSARCNLKCVMCARQFQYGQDMDQGFMPLDKAKKIVDSTYPYLTSIGLTGLGETLMYPHFVELCKYIKSRKPNLIITFSTNAHFKGYLEIIKEAIPYVDNIQISIDGTGKVYETIRPNTDFEYIRSNVVETGKLCREHNVELKLNFVIMPENFRNMKEVVDFTSEVGARSVEFNQMNIASIPTLSREFYNFFESEPYREASRELREYAKSKGVEISLLEPDPEEKPSFRNCNYPWDHPYITWDGYFVPCCGKPFPKLLNFGNVFENKSFMEVINSEKAQAFRRAWQKNEAPRYCANCRTVDF